MFSCTVRPSASVWPSRVSTSAGLVAAACATMSAASCWNCSFFATKSVSQFSSIIAPSAAATRPLLAVRSAPRLVALAWPLIRSHSTAWSKSPPDSSSARLQSIIPAPVRSRSLFTSAALMFAIARSLQSRRYRHCAQWSLGPSGRSAPSSRWAPGARPARCSPVPVLVRSRWPPGPRRSPSPGARRVPVLAGSLCSAAVLCLSRFGPAGTARGHASHRTGAVHPAPRPPGGAPGASCRTARQPPRLAPGGTAETPHRPRWRRPAFPVGPVPRLRARLRVGSDRRGFGAAPRPRVRPRSRTGATQPFGRSPRVQTLDPVRSAARALRGLLGAVLPAGRLGTRLAPGACRRGLPGEQLAFPFRHRLVDPELPGRLRLVGTVRLASGVGGGRRPRHQALGDGVGDHPGQQRSAADRVVVARDLVVDLVRVAVGVEDRHHRDAQLASLADRDVLLLVVDHPDGARHALHVPDAAQRPLQLVLLPAEDQLFLLGERRVAAGLLQDLELLQPLQSLVDGREVGQHPAQPALVHERHANPPRLFGNHLLGLLLRADEEDRAAVRDRLPDELVRLVDVGQRLLQVDDVDAVALGEDEPLHLRVPAAGLMSEVDAAV